MTVNLRFRMFYQQSATPYVALLPTVRLRSVVAGHISELSRDHMA